MIFSLVPHYPKIVAAQPPIIKDGLVDLWDYSEKAGSIIGGMFGNDATIINGVPGNWKTESDQRYQDSYEFDGSICYARTGTITHDVVFGDFTFITWMQPLSFANSGAYLSNGQYAPAFHVKMFNTQWGAYWLGEKHAGNDLTLNTWHLAAVIRRSGTMEFYRDAILTQQQHTITLQILNDYIEFGSNGLGIGNRMANCRLAMTRFYKRALLQTELDDIFAGNG